MINFFKNVFKRDRIDEYNNRLLVVFSFFMPFCKEGIEFTLSLIVLLWIIQGNYLEKLKKSLSNKVVLAFFLFYVLHYIGLLWSDDFNRAWGYIVSVKYLLLPIVFFSFIRYEYVYKLITAFILGMFVQELISYTIFFQIIPPTKYSFGGNPTPFMIHTQYSALLAFTAFLLLLRIYSSTVSFKEKIFYSFFFTTITFNLLIQFGRAGQVIFILGILLITWTRYRKNFVKIFIISLIVVCSLVLTAYHSVPNFSIRVNAAVSDITRIVNGDYRGSWGQRVAAYTAGVYTWMERPLFGYGTGDHIEAFKQKVEKDYPDWENILRGWFTNHLHNSYLYTTIQFGLVGLVLFLNIFYQMVKYHQNDKMLQKIRILLAFTIMLLSAFFKSIDAYFIFILLVSMSTFTLIEKSGRQEVVENNWQTIHFVILTITIYFISKVLWIYQTQHSPLFDILQQIATIKFYL